MELHTLAAVGGDLSKGVVTAIALATYDPGLAGTLAGPRVTRTSLRPQGEAITGVAGVIILELEVVLLEEERREG